MSCTKPFTNLVQLGWLAGSSTTSTTIEQVCIGDWLQHTVIHKFGPAKLRQGKVEQKGSLDQPVEWNPVQDGFGPEFNNVQQGKHHPVD